ncbi:MAG: AcrB/AcrD/AcrF family protein [Hydrogenobaculum sp.]|nr:MAG: AcrB/AcrD/AcrF family protein [Hydrogenobaculum sp.]PMP92548.1 MAG: AcrB/AcrD/AcrF family protein [Hydrogenobaculum sp.]
MRSFINFVLQNKIVFIFVVLLLFIFSIFGLKKLDVEPFPDYSPVVVEITAIYAGHSAKEVEKQVTIPLESALSAIPYATRINTLSLYGLSDVKVTFSYDISYDAAKQHIINRLTQANLPPGVQPVIQSNPVGEVMRFQVRGLKHQSLMDLRTLADWPICRQIKTVPGIEDCNPIGGFEKQYQVIVDPQKLVKYGLTLTQVQNAIANANINVGGNYTEIGEQTYTIRGIGLIKNLNDIKNIVLTNYNGTPITVADVGKVRIGHAPVQGYMGLSIREPNGKWYSRNQVVVVTAVMRKDAQSVPTLRALNKKIKELNEQYKSQGVELVPYYTRQTLLNAVINKIKENATIGIILILAMVIFFLGDVPIALIVASVVPIALISTLAFMALRGEEANLISLGAVDFGIIIDSAILLAENIFRISGEKENHSADYVIAYATMDIAKPVMFSILIIIASFIPLFMMSGAQGVLFSPMARTYVYALAIAIVLTFTFVPSAIGLVKKEINKKEPKIPLILTDFYIKILKQILKIAKPFTIASFIVIAIMLICFKFLGTEFIPTLDEGNIYLRITFPYSIALSTSHKYANEVRQYMMTFPEVVSVDSRAGRPEDGTDDVGPYDTEYSIQLLPYSKWPDGMTKKKLENIMRKHLEKMFPGADVNFSQYIQDNFDEVLSGVKGENSLKIYGPKLEELDKLGREITPVLEHIKGMADVGMYKELGQPEIDVRVDREKAARYGLNTGDVLNIIQAAIGSSPVTEVLKGDEQFDLVIRFPKDYRKTAKEIASIPILTPNGQIIKLGDVADVRYHIGAFFIYRENYQRFLPIKFSITTSNVGGVIKKAKEAIAKAVKLPPGYHLEWSGEYKQMIQAQRQMAIIIPVAVFIALAILYLYFKSLRYTFVAFSSAVVAIGTAIVTLLLLGMAFSVSSAIGFISVMGVSIMNGSVIVTQFIRLYESGLSVYDAVIETMKDKFRPVLMTGLVAALGLLPAAIRTGIGTQVQKPLAVVVVSGMSIGTIATLLLIPVLLYIVPPKDYPKF